MNGKEGRIGVIGGGLGGLAAACTLAARGHSVTLYEANDWVGGKAAVLEEAGFRFDMGPTILTVPSVLRRIFQEAGKRLEDYVEMVECDPQWRCFFEEGDVLDLHRQEDAMDRELSLFAPDDREGYRAFMKFSQRLDEISQRFFFYKSVESVRDTFDAKGSFKLAVLKDLMAMKPGVSVFRAIRQHVKDPRVAQMLDHFTQYVGSAPDQSPAVLCGIAHMQTDEGIWYPKGGTRAIPVALARLASELGVVLRTHAAVDKILVEDGVARGLRLADGTVERLSAVVSNADAYRTYEELLKDEPAAKRFARKSDREPACSGVVLYLGLKKAYDHLLHHNFVFSKDPEHEFEDIYRRGEPAEDPTCYVCAPSRSEAGVAPEGGEALYVLVHAPYLRSHHRWETLLPSYREVILDKLARCAGLTDLRERIVVERALTPEDIHRRYRVLNGAIYGVASHGKFLGAFKPGNRSRQIKNLYLAGGSAHPGPGMPMVMMSGWIAADALDQDGVGKAPPASAKIAAS